MKKFTEIQDIVENQLGIKTLEEWKQYWAKSVKEEFCQEKRDLLHPQNVDCRDFWKFAIETFKIDPVNNQKDCHPSFRTTSRMQANRNNFSIIETCNLLQFMRRWKDNSDVKVFEIGTGFGCFRNWVEVETKFKYTGIDCYPQFEDVIETTPEGTIPEDWCNIHKFDVIFSSNVFQHMSDFQREDYIRKSYKMLTPGGQLCIGTCFDYTEDPSPRLYMQLYGQYTEIPRFQHIKKLFDDLNFKIISTSHSENGLVSGYIVRK